MSIGGLVVWIPLPLEVDAMEAASGGGVHADVRKTVHLCVSELSVLHFSQLEHTSWRCDLALGCCQESGVGSVNDGSVYLHTLGYVSRSYGETVAAHLQTFRGHDSVLLVTAEDETKQATALLKSTA